MPKQQRMQEVVFRRNANTAISVKMAVQIIFSDYDRLHGRPWQFSRRSPWAGQRGRTTSVPGPVDGVYSADPKINSNSVRYDKLTYLDVINKSLDVMDHSALTLCKDNNIEILVFNINLPNAIVDALNRKNKTTLISNERK